MSRVASKTVAGALLSIGLSPWAVADEQQAASRHATATQPQVIEQFDVNRHGDLLVVPVEVAGRAYQFAVNTRAGAPFVDMLLRARRAFEAGELDQDESGAATFPLEGRLGKSRIPVRGRAHCVDLSAPRAESGFPVYGIIGMHLLKDYVVQLDFQAGKLTLLTAVPPDAGMEVPLAFDAEGVPSVQIALFPPEMRSFQLVTGMAGPAEAWIEAADFERLVSAGRVALPPAVDQTGENSKNQTQRVTAVRPDVWIVEQGATPPPALRRGRLDRTFPVRPIRTWPSSKPSRISSGWGSSRATG